MGGVEGQLDVVGLRAGDLAVGLAGDRGDVVEVLTADRGDPLAADQVVVAILELDRALRAARVRKNHRAPLGFRCTRPIAE